MTSTEQNKEVLAPYKERHYESESKEIQLTQGKIAMVDSEDCEWLSQFK